MSDSVSYPHVDSNGSQAVKNWFAVFTVSRHEKRVEEHLHVREIESFLPLYQTQRQWKDGSKGILWLGGRVPVLRVPGVISIVGCGPHPLPVPDSYIHFLQAGLRDGKIEPHPHLTTGTRVRIRSGVMAGLEGVLLRKKNNFRVVLTLEMIMKSVTVEIAMDDIESFGQASWVAPAIARSQLETIGYLPTGRNGAGRRLDRDASDFSTRGRGQEETDASSPHLR